jgi:hypothetical protein
MLLVFVVQTPTFGTYIEGTTTNVYVDPNVIFTRRGNRWGRSPRVERDTGFNRCGYIKSFLRAVTESTLPHWIFLAIMNNEARASKYTLFMTLLLHCS